MTGRENQLRQLTFAGQQLLRRSARLAFAAQRVGRTALRIEVPQQRGPAARRAQVGEIDCRGGLADTALDIGDRDDPQDRKSTRLNSSHSQISYAVFCLKKKKRSKPSSVSPLSRAQ